MLWYIEQGDESTNIYLIQLMIVMRYYIWGVLLKEYDTYENI